MFPQHPQRIALHNEIHARPPEAMEMPMALSRVVMLCTAEERAASWEHITQLARDHHLPAPDVGSTHVRLDLGIYRVRWEMHTEFSTWTFMRRFNADHFGDQVPEAALAVVPKRWLEQLPGQSLANLHIWVMGLGTVEPAALTPKVLFEDTLVASAVTDNCAEVYTDFMVHSDGFTRMVLLAGEMPPRRLGRLVQRLLEIETYRMAALLGLPAARAASQMLTRTEAELVGLAHAIRSANHDEEPELLDRLTRLAGEVESQHAATYSRFSASAAYFELFDKRIAEIHETRLGGLQTIGEFMNRRLAPARSTCEWAARRQDLLSQRVSRVSNLLRTRVEIEQQQSSQALLATMNSRQDIQIKLQSTVEGLSVAAISYYIVGLISYLAKGANKYGVWPWSAEMTAAVAIPFVAGGVWWSLQRIHHRVFHGK
jgi:uncharacterized membrane-anchored protein